METVREPQSRESASLIDLTAFNTSLALPVRLRCRRTAETALGKVRAVAKTRARGGALVRCAL